MTDREPLWRSALAAQPAGDHRPGVAIAAELRAVFCIPQSQMTTMIRYLIVSPSGAFLRGLPKGPISWEVAPHEPIRAGDSWLDFSKAVRMLIHARFTLDDPSLQLCRVTVHRSPDGWQPVTQETLPCPFLQ